MLYALEDGTLCVIYKLCYELYNRNNQHEDFTMENTRGLVLKLLKLKLFCMKGFEEFDPIEAKRTGYLPFADFPSNQIL